MEEIGNIYKKKVYLLSERQAGRNGANGPAIQLDFFDQKFIHIEDPIGCVPNTNGSSLFGKIVSIRDFQLLDFDDPSSIFIAPLIDHFRVLVFWLPKTLEEIKHHIQYFAEYLFHLICSQDELRKSMTVVDELPTDHPSKRLKRRHLGALQSIRGLTQIVLGSGVVEVPSRFHLNSSVENDLRFLKEKLKVPIEIDVPEETSEEQQKIMREICSRVRIAWKTPEKKSGSFSPYLKESPPDSGQLFLDMKGRILEAIQTSLLHDHT